MLVYGLLSGGSKRPFCVNEGCGGVSVIWFLVVLFYFAVCVCVCVCVCVRERKIEEQSDLNEYTVHLEKMHTSIHKTV